VASSVRASARANVTISGGADNTDAMPIFENAEC
jgi:hypothetical protein